MGAPIYLKSGEVNPPDFNGCAIDGALAPNARL